MAISIDWSAGIIYVPKDYTTLVQSHPTEIRDLDTNQFRLDLKALEADYPGMGFPKTHIHYAPVSVGGIELAMVVIITDDYTITFEDGPWAVNLKGSNNNILDRTNKNQVSVNPGNSAGLVTSGAIEFGEYGGAVTVDQLNKTGKAVSGTIYPIGTLRRPVNNFVDAQLIAKSKGFSKINIISDAHITTDVDLSYYIINGLSHVFTDLVLDAAAQVTGTTITECIVQGVMDGDTSLRNCIVKDITYLNGHIHDCSLNGTIVLGNNKDAYIKDCAQLDINVEPVIDMGGSGQDLVMANYTGIIHIINLTGNNKIGVGLYSGKIVLNSSSVTNGYIHVSGSGTLVDENDNPILSGSWNGVTVLNELTTPSIVANKVWSYER